MSYLEDLIELERQEALTLPKKLSTPQPPEPLDRLRFYKERECERSIEPSEV